MAPTRAPCSGAGGPYGCDLWARPCAAASPRARIYASLRMAGAAKGTTGSIMSQGSHQDFSQ